MCGIFCEIYFSKESVKKDEKLLNCIKRRGPDCLYEINLDINNNVGLYMCGSVLWMQGEHPTKQPLESDKGVLLYNGDIFNHTWNEGISDTKHILNMLDNSHSTEHLITQIKTLKGPFSLIYYDKQTKNLYFLRDKLGRNSLLFHKSETSHVISNVLSRKYPCIEIPATHIYKLDLNSDRIYLHSWDGERSGTYTLKEWIHSSHELQSLPDEDFSFDRDSKLFLNEKDEIITYIENVSASINSKQDIFKRLLCNNTILKTVTNLSELLEKSVQVRVKTQPNKCKSCILNEQSSCNHCTTGILFSGGLDCTILAFLADKYLPKDQPIDLINVAFNTKDNGDYSVPDRITGRQSYEELQRLCPDRLWVFREVNIPREKLEEYQLSTIGDLVYPRRTILDESLGSALWFAARAEELSDCRVLLLGSGADELFGGYVRHRNAYKRHGWDGLSKELLLDWKRISFRNLARDNRVICDHGRQPRMPYLDEDFTDYVLNLKPWLKCFPSENMPCGIGDKLILRLLAFHLGFVNVTSLPKRALQFGSRIANKKEKGSDISKTFKNT